MLEPTPSQRAPRCAHPRVRGAWLALLCFCIHVPSARAQTFAKPNGIKAGAARVHPYFELEQRFDSAVGLFPTLKPELLFHLRPGLKASIPASDLDINFDGNVDYVWYSGLFTRQSRRVSRLEAQSIFDLALNKNGPFEIQVSDTFTRSDKTQNAAIGIGVLSLYNELRIAAPIHPGGQALEVKPEFAWAAEFFEPLFIGCSNDPNCEPDVVRGTNYHNFRLGLTGRYKFLPKTALLASLDFNTRRHADPVANPNVGLLRADVGLAGQVTSKISLLAKLGWGQGVTSVNSGTLTGQLEGTYAIGDTASIKGGYIRAMSPVSGFGLLRDDRIYLEGRALFGGRLTLRARVSFDYLSFYSRSARNDRLVMFDGGPEYAITRWLYAVLGYQLSFRGSDVVSDTSLNYARHEAYLRFTFSY
jgi:hypothetical protein